MQRTKQKHLPYLPEGRWRLFFFFCHLQEQRKCHRGRLLHSHYWRVKWLFSFWNSQTSLLGSPASPLATKANTTHVILSCGFQPVQHVTDLPKRIFFPTISLIEGMEQKQTQPQLAEAQLDARNKANGC